ncbi:MBOAT family O-acyltransferase, partial [Sulfurimonas sp.]|uniref:MBOAT family O-acyltransferase n=1 Tax=Sulfurimonas sp. TaxID=2022749 RepID=UPI001A103217
KDFWRRWHITLSRFLRDYAYIPLGGNRHGEYRTHVNLMATFLLGGIWHGAGWTFVFWGFLHGLALVLHRVWSQYNFHIPRVLAWFITFNFINITWVFFRAKEWEDALKVLSSMFSLSNVVLPNPLSTKLAFLQDYGITFGGWVANIDNDGGKSLVPFCIFAFIIILLFKNSMQKMKSFTPNKKVAVFTAFLLSFGILSLTKVSEFLYFNF